MEVTIRICQYELRGNMAVHGVVTDNILLFMMFSSYVTTDKTGVKGNEESSAQQSDVCAPFLIINFVLCFIRF
jgi:hypothetical protein